MRNVRRTVGNSAFWALPLVLGALTFGCGDDDDDNPMAPIPGDAYLRALHLSPDAPEVDIFVGSSTPAVEDLAFSSGTGYLTLEAGTYVVSISAANTGVSNAVLTVPNLTLGEGERYTAVAFDNLASIQALALVDDLSSPGSGNIRVRAIHTAVGVGEVDIWNVPMTGAPTPLYTNVDFGDAGGYLTLPAGAYRLGIDVDDDMSPDLLFSLPSLAAGTVANLFAVNDGASVFLLAQLGDGSTVRVDADVPTPMPAELRAIHLSPDAGVVDVYVNGGATPAVVGLDFADGTGFLQLDPGTYDLAIAPTNTSVGAAVLTVNGLMLMEGVKYTAAAYDFAAAISALPLVDDFSDLAPGALRVRAIHTASGVGPVDIWNLPKSGEPARLYDDLVFGVAGAYFDLPAGAYTLGIDVDEDASPDLVFDLPSLPAGTIANVFAVNDGVNVHLLAQFADGTTARIDAQ